MPGRCAVADVVERRCLAIISCERLRPREKLVLLAIVSLLEGESLSSRATVVDLGRRASLEKSAVNLALRDLQERGLVTVRAISRRASIRSIPRDLCERLGAVRAALPASPPGDVALHVSNNGERVDLTMSVGRGPVSIEVKRRG